LTNLRWNDTKLKMSWYCRRLIRRQADSILMSAYWAYLQWDAEIGWRSCTS